jgi:hypothetical protein
MRKFMSVSDAVEPGEGFLGQSATVNRLISQALFELVDRDTSRLLTAGAVEISSVSVAVAPLGPGHAYVVTVVADVQE